MPAASGRPTFGAFAKLHQSKKKRPPAPELVLYERQLALKVSQVFGATVACLVPTTNNPPFWLPHRIRTGKLDRFYHNLPVAPLSVVKRLPRGSHVERATIKRPSVRVTTFNVDTTDVTIRNKGKCMNSSKINAKFTKWPSFGSRVTLRLSDADVFTSVVVQPLVIQLRIGIHSIEIYYKNTAKIEAYKTG